MVKKADKKNKGDILGHLWHIISHDKDPDSLFSHALEVLSNLLGNIEAAVFVWERKEGLLRAKKVIRAGIIQDGEEVIVAAAQSPLKGLIEGITDLVIDKHNQASICVALRDDDAFYGMLRVARISGGKYSGARLTQVQFFCSELTIALKNLRNFMQNERHVRQLKASFEISSNIVKSLHLDELLRIIVKSIVVHMGFDRVRLYLVDQRREQLKGKVSYDLRGMTTSLEHERYRLRRNVHPLVDHILAVEGASVRSRFHDVVVFVPLQVKDVVIGTLVADNILSRQRISSEEIRTIQSFAGQIAMAVTNAHLFEKIEELSITDSLTGLFVLRHFQQRLQSELYRCKRYGTAVALFIIDIDDFKQINDTFGHPQGDRVLQTIAAKIKGILRRTDFACRYGGDEFMACLLNVNEQDARQLAQRLINEIGSSCSFLKQESFSVGVSIGIAPVCDQNDAIEDVMKKADQALYEAKKSGKNQVCGWWEINGDLT